MQFFTTVFNALLERVINTTRENKMCKQTVRSNDTSNALNNEISNKKICVYVHGAARPGLKIANIYIDLAKSWNIP